MLPTCFNFTDSLLVYLQVILTVNGEGTSHNITWTDPAIPVDGQNNASFYLCANKFHKIVLRRNFSNVEFQVDGYSPVQAALHLRTQPSTLVEYQVKSTIQSINSLAIVNVLLFYTPFTPTKHV